MKRKKIDVTIFTEREVAIDDLKKLFPKMKSLHNKSEKEKREFGTNIRYKKGKLSLREGIVFTHPFKGARSAVDIEFTVDSIGTYHSHPFADRPELSVWDICDNFYSGKYQNLDCVSSSNGVACYRLKMGDKPSDVLVKMGRLCLKDLKEGSGRAIPYFYEHYDEIVEKLAEAKWKDV